MDEQIKQIAERLRGLRDVLELTTADIAREWKRSQHRTYQGIQIRITRLRFH